jgi:ATP-dependent DNA helicase RecG
MLPININELLEKNRIESNRIEYKQGWNPTAIYHTICAFANDFENLGGGYIVVGVEEENGIAKRPVMGVPTEQLDKIQQQMVGFNNLFAPYYLPRVSVEEVDGKNVVVIWAPVGINRPYSIRMDVTNSNDKREAFYVRSGTSSIVARGEVLDELRDMASRVPFDGRGNPDIKEDDIDYVLIREYLKKVKSRMVGELKHLDTMDLLERMDMLTGPTERRMIKNVAAMMFCNYPEKFFPYTQVSVVVFPEGKVKNPNRFSEKTFKGSVPTIIKGVMQYLKDVEMWSL